ncbi:MAG: AAA family ATPase, partial [Deltaproteobacteria bacterium]|nr:AAA family ATPase [Deltaproteobacteria bacterium]
EANVRFVFFYNTTLTFEELLSFTCRELGLTVKDKGRLDHLQELNTFLVERFATGGNVVLLIDEAQNLQEDVLENLRLLSNLEMSGEKLLQIVLVGQPELELKLNQPTLRQLKQRVTLQCHLGRLKDREVGPFIYYRLRAVGYEREDLFTPEALQQITRYARGIPRIINIICDNALLLTYATSQKTVSATIIDEAAHDLHLTEEFQISQNAVVPSETRGRTESQEEFGLGNSELSRPRQRRVAWASLLAILLLLGGGAAAFSPGLSKDRLANLSSAGKELITNWGKRFGLVPISGGQEHLAPSAPSLKIVDNPARLSGQALPATESSAPPQELGTFPAKRQQSAPPLPQDRIDGQPATEPLDLTQPIELKQGTATMGEGAAQVASLALTDSASSARKGRSIVIQYGSTVSRIASEVYGTNLFLAIDLLKEFNSHIQNFNWVLAGEKLWLPPLSQETLLRKQEDGSYRLILASFYGLPQAQRLARAVRLKSYSVSITPRKVANDVSLYRVEIDGLKNLAAANTTWEVALANRWLALDTKEEKRKRLSY